MLLLDFYALGSSMQLLPTFCGVRQWRIQSDKLIKIPKLSSGIFFFLCNDEEEIKTFSKRDEIYEDTNRKVQFW